MPTEEWAGQPAQTPFTTTEDFGPTALVPFGTAVYARVGDRGGNANLGDQPPALPRHHPARPLPGRHRAGPPQRHPEALHELRVPRGADQAPWLSKAGEFDYQSFIKSLFGTRG